MTRLLRITRKLLNRALAGAEFLAVYVGGKVMGTGIVVRYLRNPNPTVTVRLLRAFGAQVGSGSTVKRSLFIDNSFEDANSAGDLSRIKIGSNCYVGDCVFFDLANDVILEDNAVISGQVSFITHADCNRSEYLDQKFPRKCQPIKVEQGAWIGLGATILCGVTVGMNSVVAADSLVREDVASKTVYAGSPAKKLKDL